jgi:ADP-ribose pyrophosphatase
MVIKNWKKLSSKIAYKGEYRSILNEVFLLPDGRKDNFDNLKQGDSIGILVFNSQKEVLLVKQYRPGPERIFYGIPSGMIEKGISPITSAKKELLEETGYTANSFKLLGKFPKDGYSKDFHYLFLATDPKFSGYIENDANEWIESKFYTPTQVDKIIKSGKSGNSLSSFWIGYRMQR